MNVIALLKQTTIDYGAAVMMVTHDHRIIDSADRLVHMVEPTWPGSCPMWCCTMRCDLRVPAPDRSVQGLLTPQQLTDVAEHVKKRHFTAGETIVREGEPGEEGFFVISDGEVEVIRCRS